MSDKKNISMREINNNRGWLYKKVIKVNYYTVVSGNVIQ
jgi:hypothetical protein